MFRMTQQNRTPLVVSYLAFDIVISVFANLSYFSFYFRNTMNFSLVLFYLISVWALYLLDHYWDAKKKTFQKSSRSIFYLQNEILIQSIIVGSILIVGGLAILSEWTFIKQNFAFLFSFAICLFLVVTKLSPVPKEFLVTFFYTWGILLPFPNSMQHITIVFIFSLHVFNNVLITYQMDREWDKEQGTFTLNLWVSQKWMDRLVSIFLFLGLVILTFQYGFHTLDFEFFLGMALSYLWLLFVFYSSRSPSSKKTLSELSYLPMFVPQIIFFFSGLP